jgi:hypothetical protein
VGHEQVFASFQGAHLNGDVRQMHSILAVALEVHPQIALKAAATQHDQTQTDRGPADGCAVRVKGKSFCDSLQAMLGKDRHVGQVHRQACTGAKGSTPKGVSRE